jgi:hypothetical protein
VTVTCGVAAKCWAFRGQDVTPLLAELDALANQTIDDYLLWWTTAPKSARASVTTLE